MSEKASPKQVLDKKGKTSMSTVLDQTLIKEALLIRTVEDRLFDLFSQGKLNGTIHTCVGQEFIAVAFTQPLTSDDSIFSGHRCHGHFISFTKDFEGLLAELMGKTTGICAGIGGSQHLCKNNFYSNGVQGGIVPVSAGIALAQKLRQTKNIVVVFIGDGTLGEGVVYETMNIVSKWDIPLLFVCENNCYAQSTNQKISLAGDILKRAEAFGIKTFSSNIWDTGDLFTEADQSVQYVRTNNKPAFHLVDAYRLNSHSKSDDNRNLEEIEEYRKIDPLNVFAQQNPPLYQTLLAEVSQEIDAAIGRNLDAPGLSLNEYIEPEGRDEDGGWQPVEEIETRQAELINNFFKKKMQEDKSIVFMGEDVLSPYGGAFKVARDLSDLFPERVFGTPISEAAITGIANGLALAGFRPFLEIMFGDFVTLSMDQIVNHASKFYHMYNKQVKCPIVIRLPMGGRRGYGPTHSQTLDKFVTGIPNVKTIALNTLIDPRAIYETIAGQEEHPVIVIENKTDYGRKIAKKKIRNYLFERNNERYPVVRIKPVLGSPEVTIVCYGGMVDVVLDSLEPLFIELELMAEVIVLSKISPIDYRAIIESVSQTKKIYVVEEGVMPGGIGSEIIASVAEALPEGIMARRIASPSVPIPSVKSLEDCVLPNTEKIIKTIAESLQ